MKKYVIFLLLLVAFFPFYSLCYAESLSEEETVTLTIQEWEAIKLGVKNLQISNSEKEALLKEKEASLKEKEASLKEKETLLTEKEKSLQTLTQSFQQWKKEEKVKKTKAIILSIAGGLFTGFVIGCVF